MEFFRIGFWVEMSFREFQVRMIGPCHLSAFLALDRNIDMGQQVFATWVEIMGKNHDYVTSVKAYQLELSRVRSIALSASVWYGFFADSYTFLANYKGTDPKADPIRAICRALILGIEQSEAFARDFVSSELFNHLMGHHQDKSDVLCVFSALSYLSIDFADLFVSSGVFDAVRDRCSGFGDEDNVNGLPSVDLWFMLSSVRTCNVELLPEVLSYALRIHPPTGDLSIFKRWVTRMSELVQDQRIKALLTSETDESIILKRGLISVLQNVCNLLESDNMTWIRGSLKLILSVTSAKLISKNEGDRFSILNRVVRCLLLPDEEVHLGVCDILTNLLYSGLVSLRDIPSMFLRDLLFKFLMNAAAAMKESAQFLIRNIISLGSDVQLKEIFNCELLRLYIETFKDNERSKTFAVYLQRVHGLIEVDDESLKNEIGSITPTSKCDFEPWSGNENDFSYINVAFPIFSPTNENQHEIDEISSEGDVMTLELEDPAVDSIENFDSWVLRMYNIVHGNEQSLKRQIASGRIANWSYFLKRVCELLDSKQPPLIRGSTLLLLSMTASKLISKTEAGTLFILPRIVRCLLIDNESVHLCVYRLLTNLLYSELICVADLPAMTLTELLRHFLVNGSGETKNPARFLIHNLVSVGSDEQLKEIFD
jgi:hypothetical protein